MIEAVFISDLHLNPSQPEITERFDQFIKWVEGKTKAIYILGDFFHVWAGDDACDDWCKEIAKKLHKLHKKGIKLYYMHGNRDFLLGKGFSDKVGWCMLKDPSTIMLGDKKILLAHGDSYCIKDHSHQRFRKFTRTNWFKYLFLKLPLKIRANLVSRVRQKSEQAISKPIEVMDVCEEAFLPDMKKYTVKFLIHGHTHKPGLSIYKYKNEQNYRYVLSDWDDRPSYLCYHNTKGFYYKHV